MIRRLLALLVLALLPTAASAQVSVTASQVYLGAAPCLLRTGAGAPTGGHLCDLYLNTTTGDLFQLVNGAWIDVTSNPRVNTLEARTSVRTPVLGTVTGSLILDPASGVVLPNRNLGVSFGAPTQKFLTMHLGELWAETLVAQYVMSTIGGRIVVAPTTSLVADLAPTDTTITTKFNNLQVSDIIMLQAAPTGAPTIEFMQVLSPAGGVNGAWTYQVTRNLDGSGANSWYGGDAIVNTGHVGSGMIDLFALQGILTGYGPTIVGNVRTGTNFNDIAPRWAIGNLNNVGYGHATAPENPQPFGVAFGNRQGSYMYLDDADGLVMASTTGVHIHLRPDGSALFAGDGTGVTNINGGNITTGTITANQIAADAITSDKIAAGTILAGDVNVSAFSDTLLKNGTFEEPPGHGQGDPAGISGWSKDLSTEPGPIQASCCGQTGSGTMLLAPTANTYISVVSLAIPVKAGDTYRLAFKLYSSAATANGTHIILYEYQTPGGGPGGIRYIRNGGGAVAPDVNLDTYTFLCTSCPTTAGWRDYEYAWTVPPNVYMISIAFYNTSGTPGSTALSQLHFDDVEFTRQIGSGHLRASAVTAGKIAANAVTAGTIAANAVTAGTIAANAVTAGTIEAGAVTAGKIAAGAVTAGTIAANAVTAGTIEANAVTAGKIAANAVTTGTIAAEAVTTAKLEARAISTDKLDVGAVTADRIASRTITADRIAVGAITATELSVTKLSAITADLGDITAGTVKGVHIEGGEVWAGSGNTIRLDSSGMSVAEGNGGGSAKITLGSNTMYANGNRIYMDQGLNLADTLVLPDPPNINGGNTELYWNGGCSCLSLFQFIAADVQNVQPWAPVNPLAVLNLSASTWDSATPGKRTLGLFAADVATVVPEAVESTAAGIQSVSTRPFTIALLHAMKAEDARIKALELKLIALEAQLLAMKNGGSH